MKPTVTAILPVFNGRRFVREAVQSVMAQTLAPVELIVVDDGSTDGSVDELAGIDAPFPIRILRQENRGQSAARNLAAREAQGEYLAFLDQDDRWYPKHLQLLVKPLVANAAAGWSYSDFDEVDLAGHLVTRSFLRSAGLRHPKHTIFDCIETDLMILPSASMLRRTAFEETGGFDEALSGYEDDDLFVRMFRLGWEHAFVETPLVRFRVHSTGSSTSSSFVRSRMRYAQKLEEMLPDDPRMMRYYSRDSIAPRFFVTTLDDYVRACSARDWDAARRVLEVVNHFARRRRSSLRLKWKLAWIQNPRFFRFLLAFNERLPQRLRFIGNPTVRLR